jgi:hypothetical protein
MVKKPSLGKLIPGFPRIPNLYSSTDKSPRAKRSPEENARARGKGQT